MPAIQHQCTLKRPGIGLDFDKRWDLISSDLKKLGAAAPLGCEQGVDTGSMFSGTQGSKVFPPQLWAELEREKKLWAELGHEEQ